MNDCIHPTASVAASARIGAGTRIWQRCVILDDVIIDTEAVVGNPARVLRDVR
jgi:UDP-3-O-[3-hydroxymyristoyl] glucosamine N-acyltransferase